MPMEQNSRDDFNRAAKAAQKQIGDVEKKIGDAAVEAQNQIGRASCRERVCT